MRIIISFLISTIHPILSTKLLRRELKDYDLAVCNDGSRASYFYDQVRTSDSLQVTRENNKE